MFDLYTAVILMTILFLIITMADVMTSKIIAKGTKKRSVITCLLIAAAALGEWVGVITNGGAAPFIVPHKMAKLVEFSCAPAIGVAAAIAYGDARRPKLAAAFIIVHALFECAALRFEWVFSVDSRNIYHREAFYLIYVAVFLLSTAYCFVSVVRNGKAYQVGLDSVTILTLLMLAAGIGIQFVYSDIKIDYLCIAVGNLLFCIRTCEMILQVDAVTRLLNRRCYDVNITDMGPRAVILFFDIDKFKQVNDTYGHSVGDICLRNVAQRLRSVYGKYGLCYRIGGDEFCVILRDGIEKTDDLNAQFVSAIKAVQEKDSRMPDVSIGFSYYDAAVSHIQHVIEEADAMLYRNKKIHDGRVINESQENQWQ